MGAITVDAAVDTDADACILCCACVKTCPTGARVIEAPPIEKAAEWLSTSFAKRKEPVTFLVD